MSERKFDIFEMMGKIAKTDIEFFKNLQDYEVKQIPPLILMKWLGGSKNKAQILLTNQIANSFCFSMYKHPRLMHKILMCTTISGNRVTWMKRKAKPKDSETMKIIKEFHECSSDRAMQYALLFKKDDIIDMAESIGTDKETMTKLKKELNG